MKKKTIIFRPRDEFTHLLLEPPQPTSKFLPQWYKDLGVNAYGAKHPVVENFSPGVTAKRCVPFFDSITAGYVLTTPSDIMVSTNEHGQKVLSWVTKDIIPVDTHSKDQLGDYELPSDYYTDVIFKMTGTWSIETPKEYSLLYIHPQGRFDLPFYSLHGLVDSDKHNIPLHIPFVIKKDFEGIIRRGTPYVQMIPILRNEWHSKVEGYDPAVEKEIKRTVSEILLSIDKWYKKNRWERKIYK